MKFRKIRLGQLGNHETIAFAVEELQKYLKKIDPCLFVEVLLLDEPDAACGDVIWVGLHDSFPVPQVKDPFWDDAVAISVKDSAGYISGSNERSVLIAAYRFLQELGCRWVRPGKDGFRVTTQELDTVTVSVTEVPSSRYRGVCIEGSVSSEHVQDMIDYLPKVGLNEYFIQFMLPATFFEGWSEHKNNPYAEDRERPSHALMEALVKKLEQEVKKRGIRYHKTGHGWTCRSFGMDGTGWHLDREHVIPEETKPLLAQLNGVRGLNHNSPLDTQLCYSKPEVRSRIADTVVAYCKENPHIDLMEFWLADNVHNWCECEQCRKLRPSDWYLMILNELDEKLTAAGLNTRIVFSFYLDLLWEPLQETIHNPDRFVMLYAPITRKFDETNRDCLNVPGEMTEFVRNKNAYPRKLADNLAYLRRWKELGYTGEVILFDYHLIWGHVNDPGYEKIARVIHEDMKYLPDLGINGMSSCQVQRCFFPTNLPMHMMAKGLWDSSSDFETDAKEYYLSAYGDDGEQVHKYLAAVSEAMTVIRFPNFYLPDESVCSDYEGLYRLIRDFRPVIDDHAAREDACAADWKLLQLHSDYLLHYVRMYELLEQGKAEESQEETKKLLALMAVNESWCHPALDVGNHAYVLRRKLRITEELGEGAIE